MNSNNNNNNKKLFNYLTLQFMKTVKNSNKLNLKN